MKRSVFKIAVSLITAGMFASSALAERESFVHTASSVSNINHVDAHIPTFNDAPSLSLPTPFLSSSSRERVDAALTFVRAAGLNKNLSLLLLDTMKQDTLVLKAIKQKGLKQVQSIVVKAILTERTQFENEWDNVLAGIYSQFFTVDELTSLTSDKGLSPYFPRLVELQNEIAQHINTNGVDILGAAERSIKSRIAADLAA